MSASPTDAGTRTEAARSADAEHPFRYDHAFADAIEGRWQRAWAEADAFHAPQPGDAGFDPARPTFYCLDMFPYPSGAGLHVGHPEGYTATDIVSRYKRACGFDVLHPMGWDAFGLPAEQYAIQTGVHPAETTRTAIDNFRRQLQRFGFSYDWSREFATIDEDYYRWTQWIWLQAYDCWMDPRVGRARRIAELEADLASGALVVDPEDGVVPAEDAGPDARSWGDLDDDARRATLDTCRLAYLGEQTVNWCPALGTALANEEVIDGRSERGSHPVFRKPLKQWMFRITAYAERLLEGLDHVQWPESTRTMQREWIGRSEGAEVDFALAGAPGAVAEACPSIRVYTTRPDTIFGATFMVVAPEHRLVDAVLAHPAPNTDVERLLAYVEAARHRADVDRMADAGEKTGVSTGLEAVNPATGETIEIWTADYVLMGYGHGAVMAVPAHDERDREFADRFDLPVRDVVRTPTVVALEAIRGAGEDALASVKQAGGIAAQAVPGSGDAKTWRRRLQALVESSGSTLEALAAAAAEGRLSQASGVADAEAGTGAFSKNDDVSLDGLETAEAKARITAWLAEQGVGRRKVNYRLRDWLFSRQRYWGEPFPIVYDAAGNHYPVSADALPVRLPPMADYRPVESADPQPLLAKATDWVHVTAGEAGVDPSLLPPRTPVRRETNTMPGWAGSCWYHLRYCDPSCDSAPVGPDAERRWMLSRKDGAPLSPDETYDPAVHHRGGVDLYVGGAEHAVLHLLYARFWHMLLFDLGEVSTPEPYGRLFHQGMITSYAYQRPDKRLVPLDEVTERDGRHFAKDDGGEDEEVVQVTAKMSKSLRNVINPDDVITDYGADTFRLYEMYMGPLEAQKPWNTQDIAGVYRFLQRTWRLAVDETTGEPRCAEAANEDVERRLHRTIDKVGGDVERLAFNTAIAAMIEFVNEAGRAGGLTASQLERFSTVLSPFAPHLAEELRTLVPGATGLACMQPWPEVDPALLQEDEIEMPVQVKGKVRSRITVPTGADPGAIEAAALADPRIAELLAGVPPRKVIVVPGSIVNVIPG